MKGCASVDELASVFDTVKQALDRSPFGPFYLHEGQDLKAKQVNQVAFALLPLTLKVVMEKVTFEGVEKKGRGVVR